MIDFCYIVNLSAILQTLLCGCEGSLCGQWFQLNYILTQGPIATAIVLWGNSLVFHSLDKVTIISKLFLIRIPMLIHCLAKSLDYHWINHILGNQFCYPFSSCDAIFSFEMGAEDIRSNWTRNLLCVYTWLDFHFRISFTGVLLALLAVWLRIFPVHLFRQASWACNFSKISSCGWKKNAYEIWL